MKKYINILFRIIIPIIGFVSLFDLYNNKYSSIPYCALIAFLIYLYKYEKGIDKTKREKIVFNIYSIIISLFITLGGLIDKNYPNYVYSFMDEKWWLIPLQLLTVYSFVYPICFFGYDKLKDLKNTQNKPSIKKILIFLGIIFGCWSIYLLNFFPGLMSPDSMNQWAQAIGKYSLSNHHPVIHTMFIKIFAEIGLAIKNPTLGVALYSIFQMLIMAFIFAYVLYYMYKKNFNKYVIYGLLLFYALVPLYGIFSVTMWKDVLFGGFSIILMLQVYKYTTEKEFTLIDKIVLFISIILTALFRTNGFYAILAIDLIMMICYLKKWKGVVALFIAPTIISYIIIGPLYTKLEISKPSFTENVGILMKQVYGTIYEGKKISDKDKKFLQKLVDMDEALEVYTPYDDGIKMTDSYNAKYMDDNKAEFIKLWARLLPENPKGYVEIYLKSTYGFWYPEAQGYVAHRWPIVDNDMDLQTHGYNKTHLEDVFEKTYEWPLLKYTLSSALYLWLLLYAFAIVIIKQKYKYLITLLIPLLIWGTIMIATPLAYQPRYTYTLNCALAFIVYIVCVSFENGNERYEKKKNK